MMDGWMDGSLKIHSLFIPRKKERQRIGSYITFRWYGMVPVHVLYTYYIMYLTYCKYSSVAHLKICQQTSMDSVQFVELEANTHYCQQDS